MRMLYVGDSFTEDFREQERLRMSFLQQDIVKFVVVRSPCGESLAFAHAVSAEEARSRIMAATGWNSEVFRWSGWLCQKEQWIVCVVTAVAGEPITAPGLLEQESVWLLAMTEGFF